MRPRRIHIDEKWCVFSGEGGRALQDRPPSGRRKKQGEFGGLPTRDSSPWQNLSALRAAQTSAAFNTPRESTGAFCFWRDSSTPPRSARPLHTSIWTEGLLRGRKEGAGSRVLDGWPQRAVR